MPKGTVVAFDAAVRRIERAYDTLSRPTTITQYDASSGGNVVDEVKYTYESWGFISKFEQDHNSTVATGGTLLYDVEHSFEKVTSGRNTIRRTGMTTPSGRSVTFDYTNATLGAWFNEISRVRHVKLDSVTVATYRYSGVGHLVGTTYNEADVFSRRYAGSSLSQLDRFNRPTDWTWTKDLSTDRNFVDRDIAWDENSNVIRVEDNIHTGRDMAFSNDALNRLIMIEQGTWSGSAITSRTFQELWTLTPTGNWDLYKLDLNGNNTFTDSGDLNDDRTHNKANELTARDTDDNGTDNYTLVHDAAGNLREDGANYKFTYDAFGRLRTVLDANAGDALVAEYWYNGLGYRIAAHQDTDSDGDVDGNDTIVRFIYDERWRVVATYHDSDGSPKSEFIHHNAGLDGQGGSSYIDSVILRDRDASGDPSVMEKRVYFCQDWRHDVVAIVSDTGKMLEWVDYTPYGMPYGRPAGDTDSDYDWDATDSAAISGGGGYDVRKDANLDGVIDANDVTHANSITGGYQTLGRTVLSSTGVRNTLGYAGYVADAYLAGKWHVRHRVMDSELGRWLTRDPWGYVDGMNLYSFVESQPIAWTDAMGTDRELVVQFGHVCIRVHVYDNAGNRIGTKILNFAPEWIWSLCNSGNLGQSDFSIQDDLGAWGEFSICSLKSCREADEALLQYWRSRCANPGWIHYNIIPYNCITVSVACFRIGIPPEPITPKECGGRFIPTPPDSGPPGLAPGFEPVYDPGPSGIPTPYGSYPVRCAPGRYVYNRRR